MIGSFAGHAHEEYAMSLTRRAMLAAAIGCGLATTAARGGDDKKPPVVSEEIRDFVEYAAKNGVKLERGEGSSWWVLTDATGEGSEVVVSLKSFPAGTTEKEMHDKLMTINLAHMLNAPARLAMSSPGTRISDPTKKQPKEAPILSAKLQKLFKEYAPMKG
jgi:hypothetical protein